MQDSAAYPEFDQLWDYNNPDKTEEKFRALLSQVQDNDVYQAELLTQIARTQGLQRQFEEAHDTLDQVKAMLTDTMSRVKIRYLLERGRTFNSAGEKDKASPLFLKAWELGCDMGEDFHAIDAAHMIAIVEPLEAQLPWNLKALDLAEKTSDLRAKKWIGSLNNNIGWTYFDQADYQAALDHFEKALAYQEAVGDEERIRIGRWCVAKGLRVLGRVEEALAIQQELFAIYKAIDEADGYVYEELGECLLLLNREDEAKPYFGFAYETLSKDDWLVAEEPERLARLKALST